MKNLWKVEFDAKYTNCGALLDETLTVVANGDGMTAVRIARNRVIGRTFTDTRGSRENPRYVLCRCRYVKLTGLTKLHEIDA